MPIVFDEVTAEIEEPQPPAETVSVQESRGDELPQDRARRFRQEMQRLQRRSARVSAD